LGFRNRTRSPAGRASEERRQPEKTGRPTKSGLTGEEKQNTLEMFYSSLVEINFERHWESVSYAATSGHRISTGLLKA